MSHNFFEKSIRRSTALQTLNKFRHVLMGREESNKAAIEISILRNACDTLAKSKKIDDLDNIIKAGLNSSLGNNASISVEIIQIIDTTFLDNESIINLFGKISNMLSLLERGELTAISIDDKEQVIGLIESIIHQNSITSQSFKFGNSFPDVKGF